MAQRRNISYLLTACALVSACFAMREPALPSHGGPAWEEISSEHFAVLSDRDPAEANELIREYEIGLRVMMHLAFPDRPLPRAKLRVFALRSEELAQHVSLTQGLFTTGWFEPAIFVSSKLDWSALHELAHAVSYLYVPNQPRWFAEGIAMYLQMIRYDSATGTAELGLCPSMYAHARADRLKTLAEMWNWSPSERGTPSEARQYLTSWATVHYLIDERPQAFAAYEAALARNDEPRRAWARVFPDLDEAGFTEAVTRYLFRFNCKTTKAVVPPVDPRLDRRVLDDADVLGLRASLFMTFRGDSERSDDEDQELAQKNLRAALVRNSRSIWVYLANERFFHAPPPSVDVAKQVLAGNVTDWLAWLWYEDALRAGQGEFDQRSAALAQAAALAPEDPGVRFRLDRLEHERRRSSTPTGALLRSDGWAHTTASPIDLEGAVCALFEGTSSLHEATVCTPMTLIRLDRLDVAPSPAPNRFPGVPAAEWFAIDFRGAFSVTRAGSYAFRLFSDDGSILWIDGRQVIDNDGLHAEENRLGRIDLTPGPHDVRVLYFQGPGNVVLQLFVTPPGESEHLWSPGR